jgi:exosortase
VRKKLPGQITKTQLTLIVKILTLLVATIALFGQDLIILFNDALYSELTSYLLAVPFLFAYLIYRKRKMLGTVTPLKSNGQSKEIRYFPTITGILLGVTAILLYWSGTHTFTPLEYHMVVLPIFVAGLTLIFFNFETVRQLAFPIAFLIFLMPPPSEILYAVGTTLSTASSEVPNAILNTLRVNSTIIMDTYGNPTIIITRPDGAPINFEVGIACSGIYSLIGFLLFAVFVAYIIRDKPWKKFSLIALGVPLVYLLNILRITTILLLGYQFGEGLALQVFHLLGGWVLIFLGTLLLLVISEKIFRTRIFADTSEKCSQCNPKLLSGEDFCFECGRILKPKQITLKKIDVIKIGTLAVCLILLLSIQAPVFALTQASPAVLIDNPSGQQVSMSILPQVSNYNLSGGYRDTEFEKISGQDMSIMYLYSPLNESGDWIWVAVEISSTLDYLHRWETCLITWPLSKGQPPRATQIELSDLQLTQNPPIIGRYFAFNYTSTNETQVVLYWFETTLFWINSTSMQKHVMISVIAFPENTEDLPRIKNELIAFAGSIAGYWEPIKTWSQITLLISENGLTSAAMSSTLIAVIILLYAFETRRQRKANAIAYQKLSKPNQQIINALRATDKSATPTLDNIAKNYQKTGELLDKTQLLNKLYELEKTGIIKSAITSRQDEPIQIWRTQMIFKIG